MWCALDLLVGLLVGGLRVSLGVAGFGGVFSCWLLSNSVFCVWVGLGMCLQAFILVCLYVSKGCYTIGLGFVVFSLVLVRFAWDLWWLGLGVVLIVLLWVVLLWFEVFLDVLGIWF